MENTLRIGDHVLVNKVAYGARTPQRLPFTSAEIPFFRLPAIKRPARGDVVVFEFPGARDELLNPEEVNFVKRCVAVAGDTVQVLRSVLYVNGKAFPNRPGMIVPPEPTVPQGYRDQRMFPPGACYNKDHYGPVVVPGKGDTIYLAASALPRWLDFIKREGHDVAFDGAGSVLVDHRPTNEYIVQRDYIFVMGDNRDNSMDSRFWGFVPEENVIGEVTLVYWSRDPDATFWPLTERLRTIRWDRIFTFVH
jgi:signal peptidase I